MAGEQRVAFTQDSAKRIAAATLAYERGNRDQPPIKFRQPGDDGGDPVRLGKTTAAWSKNSLATITLYEEGTPPSESAKSPADTLEDCVNKFTNVASGKWVMVARAGNGYWYLIAAEC
jgi:hypothetical protein